MILQESPEPAPPDTLMLQVAEVHITPQDTAAPAPLAGMVSGMLMMGRTEGLEPVHSTRVQAMERGARDGCSWRHLWSEP